jgi:hypothetical protein
MHPVPHGHTRTVFDICLDFDFCVIFGASTSSVKETRNQEVPEDLLTVCGQLNFSA